MEVSANPAANLDIPNTHGHCLQRIKSINLILMSIHVAQAEVKTLNSVWILNRVNFSRSRLRRYLCAEKRIFLMQYGVKTVKKFITNPFQSML